MVRNIVILSGNSHPSLTEAVCNMLGIPNGNRILSKFSVGETRCEIKDSVRGKDVFIIQSGGGSINDHLIELCIMISACKTGSAKRVTAVLPLFPYSRQPDLPYNKIGAPLSKPTEASKDKYTFESVPATPGPGVVKSASFSKETDLTRAMSKTSLTNGTGSALARTNGGEGYFHSDGNAAGDMYPVQGLHSRVGSYTTHDYENPGLLSTFQAKPGYKRWVAQAGTLVADLLTCAGADHVVALDLHDPQYQGFFDIPMDNLYGRPLLKRYIQQNIPDYKEAVIVSPDAGGTKRATAIADSLGMEFALIHKERRPPRITDRQNATMMLVGNVANRVCILIDDLADTANTITRAAKLLRKEGAVAVYALLTHGVLSGDAIARINASALDKVVVTNSVPQDEHKRLCPKLDVLDVAPIFAEAIRRIHHGESISVLFQYA
ncbi:phosphoribosyl pyrophosphokinase [Durotheca rogersii]|uniref:phosphoribosyl pyrophosphokinase n=1 Tax=Durotheca rogersii TaxID=419775 RepID=UPI00221F6051|nr:phosphoribosyl pyrophosphokinase [Durotheca rogersii]XP_051374896.1 phosphoribosyl pyrophosphokinase [Durotheca rogersii]KAI5849672.1 phosphoribosyl pyrophosphokinase [Durotheca rogersii]KAI5866186.1 phosphoribosyl pyrophosphokinase [Durotheca rogersii]